MMKLVVLSTSKSWHFQDLVRAAGEHFQVINYPFENLTATVAADPHQSQLPQPLIQSDCVITRVMPPGSLEQVVFRMDVLGTLERLGIPIINSPLAIEISIDKYRTLSLLAENQILVPKTAVSQSADLALQHFEAFNRDVVVKPIFGSMGRGVERLNCIRQARQIFENKQQAGEVIYQQQFLQHEGFDIRLIVIGETVIGMKRHSGSGWITNIAKGGVGESYIPSDHESEIAITAARTVGTFFAGVDLVYQKDQSQPFVLEVNACPGWQEISRVTKIDIAKKFLSALQKHLGRN
ncbi:MAG: RimK family alpha-L-glutamate ligase [Planctomycetota bacterium]